MWKRTIEVDISIGDTAIAIRELHVHFKYEGKLGWTADQCKIDIYNLANGTVMGLMNATTKSAEIRISLRAGHEYGGPGILPTVFEGVITNVFARRQLPDYITTLYCVPVGASDASRALTTTFTIPRGATIREAFRLLGAEHDLPEPQYFGVTDATLQKEVSGVVLRDAIRDMYSQLAKLAGAWARFTDDGVRIVSTLKSADTISFIKSNMPTAVIDVRRVKGMPSSDMGSIQIPYLLDATLEPGQIIDVAQLQASGETRERIKASGVEIGYEARALDGSITPSGGDAMFRDRDVLKWAVATEYQIIATTHEGSNYLDVWDTTISGHVFKPGTNGAN